jgi:small subunit ribosomal protein S9
MKVKLTSGKRKTAIARATIREGKGQVFINKEPLENVKPELVRMKIEEPLNLVGNDMRNSVRISLKVDGGGVTGQADACRIAIARALLAWSDDDKALRDLFIEFDRSMVVGDSRRSERKKFGGPKARARYTKSYR